VTSSRWATRSVSLGQWSQRPVRLVYLAVYQHRSGAEAVQWPVLHTENAGRSGPLHPSSEDVPTRVRDRPGGPFPPATAVTKLVSTEVGMMRPEFGTPKVIVGMFQFRGTSHGKQREEESKRSCGGYTCRWVGWKRSEALKSTSGTTSERSLCPVST